MCVCASQIKVNCCKQIFGECMAFFHGEKKGSSKPGHPLSGGSVLSMHESAGQGLAA